MAIGLLGRKVGMTQLFLDGGEVVPCTVLQVGPCKVLQVKTNASDGYEAVQVGFEDMPRRLASRSQRGHVAKLDSKRARTRGNLLPKADCEPQRLIREFRVSPEGYEVGQTLSCSVLAEVKKVDVTGTSKGRGFSGVMRRHNMKGQRATHGAKKVHRQQGSTGQNTWPGRVIRGKHMAGQYGNERSTMRNLKVVRVDAENNLVLVRGAVPGPNGGFVLIRETNMVG